MSVVDWSQAPEGAVAHVVHSKSYSRWEGWTTFNWDGRRVIYGLGDPAPHFGIAPGTVTLRPSAAEAELRAEVERLRAELKSASSAESPRVAFGKLREELGDSDWTVSESIIYYGFFLHGWKASRG